MPDEQLIGQLIDQARASGLPLTGEGGLVQQLTKRVLESALEGEITDHLGHERRDLAAAGSGNSRNGGPVQARCSAGLTAHSIAARGGKT
ncbi:transposase [Streptomyces sp. NPDC005374]|uniref:transposase n=1 Tax=Streptomyces sp. NPDC005374 TaxID=3364713 RepID=UPI0036B20174